jgi:cytochrome c1
MVDTRTGTTAALMGTGLVMSIVVPGLGLATIPALATGGIVGTTTVGSVGYYIYSGSHAGKEGRSMTRTTAYTLSDAGKSWIKWGLGNIGKQIAREYKKLFKEEKKEKKSIPKGKDKLDKATGKTTKAIVEEVKDVTAIETQVTVTSAETQQMTNKMSEFLKKNEQVEQQIDRNEIDIKNNIAQIVNYFKKYFRKDGTAPLEASKQMEDMASRVVQDIERIVAGEKELLSLSTSEFKDGEEILVHQKQTVETAKILVRNARKQGKKLKRNESKVIKSIEKILKGKRKEKKKLEKVFSKTTGKYARAAKERVLNRMDGEVSSLNEEYQKVKELEKYLHSVITALRLSFKKINIPITSIAKANKEAQKKGKTFKRSIAKGKLQLSKLDKRSGQLKKSMGKVTENTPVIPFMGNFVTGVIDIQELLIKSYALHNTSYQQDLIPLFNALKPVASNGVKVIRITEYIGDALGKLAQAVQQLDKLASVVAEGSTIGNIAQVKEDLDINLKTEGEIIGTLEEEKGVRNKEYKFFGLVDRDHGRVSGELQEGLVRLADRENKVKNQFAGMEQILGILDDLSEKSQERHKKILAFEQAAIDKNKAAQATALKASREARRRS